MDRPSRRSVLAGAALAALAGCAGPESAQDGTATPDPTRTPEATEPPTGTPTETAEGGTPTTEELDLREANVVGVEVTDEGDGSFQFAVTLHHDDGGEDGYANWWQVETRDGDRLGRRDLTHPHSQQPFTRSATVDVPAAEDCVVVRGHDQTHGYGGAAMLVVPATGETAWVAQGSEPAALADRACPGN